GPGRAFRQPGKYSPGSQPDFRSGSGTTRPHLQPRPRHPSRYPRRPRQSPRRHRARTGSTKMKAVFYIGFGGPEKREEIRPFLETVTRGRGIPPARLEEVAHHYEAIGGKSPINEITNRQAEELRKLLNAECGTRNAEEGGPIKKGIPYSEFRIPN